MLELSFTMDPHPQLVATRFTHPKLKERERRTERGEEEGEFRWTRSLKALCIMLLRYAAWARRGEGDEPVLEGRRPSPATSLNDALSKCTGRWLDDIFGQDGGQLIVLSLLQWKNRDMKTAPGGPVRLRLSPKNLAASEISVVVDGRPEERPEHLLALARRIEGQHWGRARGSGPKRIPPEGKQRQTAENACYLYPPGPLSHAGAENGRVAPVLCNAPPLPALFVGREGALHELRDRLGCGGKLVVIRGWPGVGKSTAAIALAHDACAQETFPDGVLWASLGQEPILVSELVNWGRMLGSDRTWAVQSVKEASGLVRSLLHSRRMLLIVDDVWMAEHAEAFRVAGQFCTTVITTRVPRVAEAVAPDPDAIYLLPVLSEDSSVDLLRRLAPSVVAEHPEQCRELAREVQGLPLALQVAGRLLHVEAQMGWGVDDLLRELREEGLILEANAPPDCADLMRETTPKVVALMRKSTDHLDEDTRAYFAMLGAFAPKPATFDLKAVAAVWEVRDPKPMIRELVARGLLEPVSESRFWMHALLAKHAETLLGEQ